MTTDVAQGHENRPTRSLEVERKYDVDADTPVPDWTTVPGVVATSPGELRELDAQYLDTADFSLATSGFALRRRTGGPDAGWHLKGPRTGDGRVELGWPLGEEGVIPDAVISAIAPVQASALAPIARIENSRMAFQIAGADGVIAEFVDDHVRATDLRTGTQREWREWEFELGPAAPTDDAARDSLFTAAEHAIFAAGARPSASGSKLARALGR